MTHRVEDMILGLIKKLETAPRSEHNIILESIKNLENGETPAPVPEGLEWLIQPGEITEEGIKRAQDKARYAADAHRPGDNCDGPQ
jgi:hypothetical protein